MKLKEFRLQKGLSQAQFAKIAKTSQRSISNYENELSSPTMEVLVNIADYFHTTIDHIVGHEVPYLVNKAKYSAEQLAVLEELEKLDNEQCFAILAFIEGMKSGKEQQNKILARFRKEADEA